MTFCDTTAGTGNLIVWHTNGKQQTVDGQIHIHEDGNSYLDEMSKNPSTLGFMASDLCNSCLMYKRGFEGIQLAYQSIFCLSNRQIKDQSEAIRKVYPNPMNKEIGKLKLHCKDLNLNYYNSCVLFLWIQ